MLGLERDGNTHTCTHIIRAHTHTLSLSLSSLARSCALAASGPHSRSPSPSPSHLFSTSALLLFTFLFLHHSSLPFNYHLKLYEIVIQPACHFYQFPPKSQAHSRNICDKLITRFVSPPIPPSTHLAQLSHSPSYDRTTSRAWMRCIASSITSHANVTYRLLSINLQKVPQYHTSQWLAKEHALRPATPSRASSRPLTPRLPSSAPPSPRLLRSLRLNLQLSRASPLVLLRRRPRRRTVSLPRLVRA